jgi:hypothetical protein
MISQCFHVQPRKSLLMEQRQMQRWLISMPPKYSLPTSYFQSFPFQLDLFLNIFEVEYTSLQAVRLRIRSFLISVKVDKEKLMVCSGFCADQTYFFHIIHVHSMHIIHVHSMYVLHLTTARPNKSIPQNESIRGK